MDPAIRPGARVRVRFAGPPSPSPCQRHLQRDLPLSEAVGVVDRLDERYGDHLVVVRFFGIRLPIFGEPWVDSFRPDELLPLE